MLKYHYVFFLLMCGSFIMIPLLGGWMRKKRFDSVKAKADPVDVSQKPFLTAVPYRRPQLDTRGLQKLNRDLQKLYAFREKGTKWALLWVGVMAVSMVLGILTHEDMVFYAGMLFAMAGVFSM